MDKRFYISLIAFFLGTSTWAQTTLAPSPLVTAPHISPNTIPKPVFEPPNPEMFNQPITTSIEAEPGTIKAPTAGEVVGGGTLEVALGLVGTFLFVPPHNPASPYDDVLIKPAQRKIQYGFIGPPTLDAYQRNLRLNQSLSKSSIHPYTFPPFAITNSNGLTIERALEFGDIFLGKFGEKDKRDFLREAFRTLFTTDTTFNSISISDVDFERRDKINGLLRKDPKAREMIQSALDSLLGNIPSQFGNPVLPEIVLITHAQEQDDETHKILLLPILRAFSTSPLFKDLPKIGLINPLFPINRDEYLNKLSGLFYSAGGEIPPRSIQAQKVHLMGGYLMGCLSVTLVQLMDEYFASNRRDDLNVLIHYAYSYSESKDQENFEQWWKRREDYVPYMEDNSKIYLNMFLGKHAFEKLTKGSPKITASFYKGPEGEGLKFSIQPRQSKKTAFLTLLR